MHGHTMYKKAMVSAVLKRNAPGIAVLKGKR